MDWAAKTVKTYDESAESLSKYFSGIGPRIVYIELGLRLAKTERNARVIEIGCGDGRDAAEIIKRVGYYQAFDPSKALIKLAKKKSPSASFILADALSYKYPNNIDVVYAFASLLHINKKDLKEVFKKVAESLRIGGIFYISLKERSSYEEEVKKDRFGERMFYYYNSKTIIELGKDIFKPVHICYEIISGNEWIEMALEKI